MSKTLKYIIAVVAILLLVYFSVDIQNLEEYRSTYKVENFDADAYANTIWENNIPLIAEQAPALTIVMNLLESNPEEAYIEYGKKLGISKTWYFMVKGFGTIESVDDEALMLKVENDHIIQLATSFIFGNAVREGSGVVNIDDFLNMTDFNNVSVALNKKVKSEIIPLLKNNLLPGQQLSFAGVFEFNEENGSLTKIRIIPVSVEIKDAE